MKLIPFERETMVLTATATQLGSLLKEVTQTDSEETDKKVFAGVIKGDHFAFSLKVSKPQSFIPQVVGTIHSTSSGCLLFLQYRFFPSTNFFLAFWCVASLLLAFLFFGLAKNSLYAGLSLLACLVNYVIAMANFGVHLKETRKTLHKVLEQLT